MPKSRRIEPHELEEKALTLRTVGWTLLIFDVAVISLFIFVGLRSGSLLWLYWAVIQGAVGIGMVVVAKVWEQLAGHWTGQEAEPHTEAGDRGERAA